MKSTDVNLVHFLSVLSLSFLLFTTVSALTNSNDVKAIQLLIDNYHSLGSLATDDQADPCLPEPYSWVNCSSGDTPRVTALNLHHSGALYNGDLYDFSALDALEIIDLSDNILGQEFPDFLADFPKLKVLNLANNFFTGTVPTSLRKKSKEGTLNLTLTGEGMNELCFSDKDVCPTTKGTKTSPGIDEETSTNSGNKKTTPIVLGILIPIFMYSIGHAC
ncbi:hypothetical protein C5167_001174 [Papaver somniferum]|uniref:Leucine-rich repeat-containing N-terminal plant-type domain-containing protein n=1 Tax=Papaver somniferum TaxID=3469 RepID=A0A4Y7KV09_PAPSO|nr:LRR receptor-like serine/threonine-protein kinase IOS1 isoform X2 [Papaver somniferum]RZC76200.1 hypothetical protein C5167_001174 [Papaver somniferum]